LEWPITRERRIWRNAISEACFWLATKRRNALRYNEIQKKCPLNPLPIFKPKGMHQWTWDRIRFRIQSLEGIIFIDLDKK
jgi:hypothetical protein